MRESNFAFPAQNKACVCITSQLYDRRALDTSSALPLFNSLQHLTYLTSTSPRIREIMTMDGGLERLVRILHDFCLAPPPLASPAAFYGLLPPSYHAPRPPSQLNPPAGQFDKYAASRFSLAFKCVVNIGVRGSEPIRSRVVQAGTLDVVGCILEAWLAGRGFAVGPSTSATGLPRETREARAARRAAAAAGRLRADPVLVVRRRPDGTHHAREPTAAPAPTNSLHSLHAALQHVRPALPPASPSTSSATSTTSARGSPISHSGPGTSSRASPVSSRASPVSAASSRPSSRASPSPSPSETDGDVEGDAGRGCRVGDSSASASPSPPPLNMAQEEGRGGNMATMTMAGMLNANIMGLNANLMGMMGMGMDGMGLMGLNRDPRIAGEEGMGMGIGINGVIESPAVGSSSLGYEEDEADLDEEEGEVVVAVLGGGNGSGTMRRAGTVRGPSRPALPEASTSMSTLELRRRATAVVTPEVSATATGPSVPPRAREREDREERHHHHHHHAHGHSHQTGPYRDDDVLLSLQLLAYLSKYPHVRQAFYKRRNGFHPASALAVAAAQATEPPEPLPKAPEIARDRGRQSGNGQHSFLRAFGAGKEKEKGKAPLPRSTTSSAPIATAKPSTSTPAFETNVFSLVERFTFRPSSSETDLPNPPPRLPQEIQYWAGVIMRNACRKDDSRGGIRQCARMLCGRWEEYPREFAKCRRCRKAKYCGKECQSTAWSEGHRFWCSAKEGDDAPDSTAATAATSTLATSVSNAIIVPDAPEQAAMLPVGAERRERRERNAARERERLVSATTAHPNTVAGTAAPSAESTRTRAMALLRRAANPGAQDAAAPGHLHHPQPQNPADIDRYLANFASRPDEGSEHEMSLD
ncbi:hypothetical protein FB45DRAFT_742651 [Roridomyces roridus]|uniref:MYND-type domain-containing protein n=1 Tax=Roridomyces roridus TaxID=1738132 RepID=A0AAD7C2G0_9AGAR|nr:hypothetical protein FB45DRAFT_742651 [Roridomyces roridus]